METELTKSQQSTLTCMDINIKDARANNRKNLLAGYLKRREEYLECCRRDNHVTPREFPVACFERKLKSQPLSNNE